jgi:monoamine oxidase
MGGSAGKREVRDVAIVGAGVSGVYVGWRLLSARAARSVTIYEQSASAGGRLLSLQPPGLPGVWCELGGMRFTSNQPLVCGLIQQLELATHPFAVTEDPNINYLRGVIVRQEQFADPKVSLPYDLDWAERGMDPDSLLGWAIDQVIPGATKMESKDLRRFLKHYTLDGRHLYDWGFWNLLARGLSHEAYELARATSGYDTPLLNWNALDTISLNFDLAVGVTYNALSGGYQSLPRTLAHQFKEMGGTIEYHQTLDRFKVDSDGIVLYLHDKREDTAKKQHDTAKEQHDTTKKKHDTAKQVQAGALVLAMPRRSLELLDPRSPIPGPENGKVRALIETVTPIPLFKLCVAYDYPWWESVGVTQGRSQTDLPIRQCYYWATGRAQQHDPDNRKAVLLATYDDGANVDFWNGYSDPERHEKFAPRADDRTEAYPGSREWSHYAPTAAMVDEADQQLREMHGLRVSPPPYAAAYKDWAADPFGGGVNFWNIHARSSKVIRKMINPVTDVPAYVCGEAYSNGQGWVEGALETAELVLTKHFGVPPPAWVPS